MVELVMVNDEFKTTFICWLKYLKTGYLYVELPPIKEYTFTININK